MLEIGDKIGDYTLRNYLGSGNYGVVWLGEKPIPFADKGVLRALKFLSGYQGKAVEYESVRREVNTWVDASGHPNVVSVIDAFADNGRFVIVSEYAGSGSLRDLLDKNEGKAPSVEKAVEMMKGILNGLAHLHHLNITHRDLKPENILLHHGTPRIADFGMSRIVVNITRSFTLAGTPIYMSPEAFTKSKNPQIDIWAAGVIFYEMLCGQIPFEGDDLFALHNAIIVGQIKPLPLEVPEELRKIVIQALHKESKYRFQNATEMQSALDQAIFALRFKAAKLRETLPDDNWQVKKDQSALLNEFSPSRLTTERQKELSEINLTPEYRTSRVGSSVRIYDLAKDLKLDTKFLIKELRSEGADVSVPSNSVSKELADKIRNKYLSKRALPPERMIKVISKKPNNIKQSNLAGEDFGSILEKFEQEQTLYHSGEMVEGTVGGVSERGVLIDFGHRSEGIAPIEDFISPTGEVTVEKGEAVEVIIKSISSGDAPPVLSRKDALNRKSWDVIEKAFNDEASIAGRVFEITKGGLRVDINGVEAFLPGSQVDSRPIRNLDSFIGQELEVKVIKFSRKRNNVVLSRKFLTDKVVSKLKAGTLSEIAEGYIIEGTIKHLTEYGAFVDIGGIDGLLHISDMSWRKIEKPSDIFRIGDTIQVKIIRIDRNKGRISLGYKQLFSDPWKTFISQYKTGDIIRGRISRLAGFGAFVQLDSEIEGICHISELSFERVDRPEDAVQIGQELTFKVLRIENETQKVGLSRRAIL